MSLGPVLAPASGRPAHDGERQSNPDGGAGPDAEHTAQAIDWGSYMADLQRRIRRQWFPPHNGRSNKVRAIFTVHKDGQISNLRLLVSSGLSVSDQAALKAIETAAPLRPLPRGAGESVDIEFTFDYNVFGSGGKAEFKNY